MRISLKRLRKVLEDHTVQYRVIQKRLLNRFKDKNPSALNNLDFLLSHTYRQIVDAANHVDSERENLNVASEELTSTLELCIYLLKISFDMS